MVRLRYAIKRFTKRGIAYHVERDPAVPLLQVHYSFVVQTLVVNPFH